MKYFIMMGDSQDKRHWAALYTHLIWNKDPQWVLDIVFIMNKNQKLAPPENSFILSHISESYDFDLTIVFMAVVHCEIAVSNSCLPHGMFVINTSGEGKGKKQNGPNGGPNVLERCDNSACCDVCNKIILSKSGNASNTFLSHKPKFQECIAAYFIICVFCSNNRRALQTHLADSFFLWLRKQGWKYCTNISSTVDDQRQTEECLHTSINRLS